MPDLHLSRRVQHAATGFILLLISYIIPPFPTGFILLSTATAAFYQLHRRRVHDECWDRWYLERFGALLRDHERGEWEVDDDDDDDDIDVTTASTTAPTNNNNENGSKPPPIKNARRQRRRRKSSPALPGAFYFLLGTTLSTLLFPVAVAQTSLLILSFADPMAGIVGAWFSEYLHWNITWKQLLLVLLMRRRHPGAKPCFVGEEGPSVAGSLACAITSILCTYVYISSLENSNSTILSEATGAGIFLSFRSRVCVGVMTAVAEAMSGRNNLPLLGTVLVDDNLTIPLAVGCLLSWLT